MSLLLNQPSQLLCFGRKPVLVRSSPRVYCGYSSSSLQTPPCFSAGFNMGYFAGYNLKSKKKVPPELVYNDINDDGIGAIGSCHGWIATLKDDGILRLQDDLNPLASDIYPKSISLPPLVTLPHCQTQVVTNVSMSCSSPEDDEDCVVAVKFLGSQLSFCRPARKNSEWTNIRITNPCFYSSQVMFSKKHDMFRIPGSGGHVIGSWDLCNPKPIPKIQKLQFQNLPDLTKTKRDLLLSCFTSEHLVESPSTGETFLLKWYKRTAAKTIKGMTTTMKTKAVMVFRLDKKGNAVYTQDIGDVCIFLSRSETFCVLASSFQPGLLCNHVYILDVDEFGMVELADSSVASLNLKFKIPFHIPPQNIIHGD